MDPLQRLHTLVNLAALLAAPLPSGFPLPRTLRDDRLLVRYKTSIIFVMADFIVSHPSVRACGCCLGACAN